MGIPLELSLTSASSVEGGTVEYDGAWYKRISGDEAYRIRFDIQLYICNPEEQGVRADYDTPESYRREVSWDPDYAKANTAWWKRNSFCILIDNHDKEEYVCES